ncbi:MAG TPA: hypothetical protein VGH56_09575 [Solirubrobacteraceae bacterium]
MLDGDCVGTVTLQTLARVPVTAGHFKRDKNAILTLASAPFAVAGGRVITIKLHLSLRARALLAGRHVMRVQATITAHDRIGVTHTVRRVVTIRSNAVART